MRCDSRFHSAAPPFAVICGRGSSGHAGVHLRYLIETKLGIAVSAAAPSVVTSYRRPSALAGALFIVISQSGGSPDLVAREIDGIGFKTADKTAQKLGIGKESDMRIDAGVEYVLNDLSNDGHTCYPVNLFLEKAQELLEVDANQVAARLAAIEQEYLR